MKDRSLGHSVGRAVVFALALVCLSVLPARAESGPSILLQQTPVNGGVVNPGNGVHSYERDSTLSVTATPNPGYEFVYWIGDVSDPTSSKSSLYVDGPKIVVAVFQRVEFELPAGQGDAGGLGSASGAGGSRALRRSGADYSRQGYSGGGGAGGGGGYNWPFPTPLPNDRDPDDFPVPDVDNIDDFPVPEEVPEPATIFLLLSGGLLAFSRRRRN